MCGWREVETDDGTFTFAHPVHGETCHSTAGAWTQARERYARACRLTERAEEIARVGGSELRLLDIGTGLGLNLAAALEAVDGTGVALRAVSMERNESVLREMLRVYGDEPAEDRKRARHADLERWHAPVRAAIADVLRETPSGSTDRCGTARFGDVGGSLELHVEDARVSISRLPTPVRFDAIFLDPFSPRVEPDLWEPEFLIAVAGRLAPGGWLSTYTVSLGVRAALVAGGLHVGRGERVGRKAQGTVASLTAQAARLDERTQRRVAARARALIQRAGDGKE